MALPHFTRWRIISGWKEQSLVIQIETSTLGCLIWKQKIRQSSGNCSNPPQKVNFSSKEHRQRIWKKCFGFPSKGKKVFIYFLFFLQLLISISISGAWRSWVAYTSSFRYIVCSKRCQRSIQANTSLFNIPDEITQLSSLYIQLYELN